MKKRMSRDCRDPKDGSNERHAVELRTYPERPRNHDEFEELF